MLPTSREVVLNSAALPQHSGLFGGQDFDDSTSFALSELHSAIYKGEKGIVSASPDVTTGVKGGASLANENGSCRDRGTAKSFDS
jgi:hypothetical protein